MRVIQSKKPPYRTKLRDIQTPHVIARYSEISHRKKLRAIKSANSNSVQNEETNPQHLNDDADLKKLSSLNQGVAKASRAA
jgi:hypothetical protein